MITNLLILGRKKKEPRLKRLVMPAGTLTVLMLVPLAPPFAFSQVPTSGAMLTINGTVALGDSDSNFPVNQNIYDSQIHTGNVRQLPAPNNETYPGSNCTAGDQAFETDADVLNGGSSTGCNPGVTFATTQGEGQASVTDYNHDYNFSVTTEYLENGDDSTFCNTSETICANPDSGFLTVTNNNSGSFTGTITLSGTAVNPTGISAAACPTGGAVSDSFSGTLAPGSSVTLALSPVSRECGGFNQPQTQVLSPNGTITFQAGPLLNVEDSWTVSAFGNVGGEQITFNLYPYPKADFVAGPLFPSGSTGTTCDEDDSLSAAFEEDPSPYPVCATFVLTCSVAADCNTFSHTLTVNYQGEEDNGPPLFLQATGSTRPTSNFDQNIITFYGAQPNIDQHGKKSGGGGMGDYHALAYVNNGNAPPFTQSGISVNTYASPFYPPLSNPPTVNDASTHAANVLIWQSYSYPNGTIITPSSSPTLTLCTNSDPTTCSPNTVAIQYQPISCGAIAANLQINVNTSIAGNSGLQFNKATQTWQINGKSSGFSSGECAALHTIFTGTGYTTSTGQTTSLQSTHTVLFKYH